MKLSPPTTPFEQAAIGTVESWSEAAPTPPPRPRSRLRRFLRHPFTLFVLLPTLLVTGYYFTVAAPQYVSEARIVVRTRGETQHGAALNPLATILGAAGNVGAGDASTVREYLLSNDAVRNAQERIDLVTLWQRAEADPVARLYNTEPELLARYYNDMVSASIDSGTGVLTMRVRAFRPEDAKQIADTLLDLSESLVNRLSTRAREDALRFAQEEVTLAEQRVVASREALTRFREDQQDLDSASSATASQQQIVAMEAALTGARAELRERMTFMRTDNPALQGVRNRIEALERQIEAERLRRTRGDGALVQQLANYERLNLEREFADRQLASATAGLEGARMDAQRQQVYLARVAEPNLPVYPLYPRKLISIGSVFLGLAVAFGIGWLLLASMRDHAA